MARSLGGRRVFVAIATPVRPNFSVDIDRLVARAQRLLAAGCDGVAPMGTTGEGPGFAAAERRTALAALAAALPADRLVAGVSAAAMRDALELAEDAAARGVAAILAHPPFFMPGAARPEGVIRFYDAMVEVIAGRAPLLLYHIPQVTGVAVTHDVVRALVARHGERIGGVKDSGGDLAFTLALCRDFPMIDILPGTETDLPAALAAGAAGTICGLANLAPALIRRLVEASGREAEEAVAAIAAIDRLVESGPFVPTLKAAMAAITGDDAWVRPLPPRAPVDPASIADALAAIDARLRQRWGAGLV